MSSSCDNCVNYYWPALGCGT